MPPREGKTETLPYKIGKEIFPPEIFPTVQIVYKSPPVNQRNHFQVCGAQKLFPKEPTLQPSHERANSIKVIYNVSIMFREGHNKLFPEGQKAFTVSADFFSCLQQAHVVRLINP